MKYAPIWLQNLLVRLYNTWLYKKRRAGGYRCYREYYAKYNFASCFDVEQERSRRLSEFVAHSLSCSKYYIGLGIKRFSDFPVLEKKTLLDRLEDIATITEKEAEVSLTGGTTGASMKVLYKKEDIQERHALLDHFRAGHGYELGKRPLCQPSCPVGNFS